LIDFAVRNAANGPTLGIQWTKQSRLTDVDFADDIRLLAETFDGLQELTTNLEAEAGQVEMNANRAQI